MSSFATLGEVLLRRALQTPDAPAYHFLAENLDVREQLTYGQLHQQALRWKQALDSRALAARHVLLTFTPGLAFVAAFFGCLYAGKIAVPTHLPTRRGIERFVHIASLCGTTSILCDAAAVANLRRNLDQAAVRFDILCDGDLPEPAGSPLLASSADTAFLQFTSGSTASPKGVVITHANILSNQAAIQSRFAHDRFSRVLGWLPMYHDMGLIGIVMQPLFAAIPCWMMAPAHFARDPLSWLAAISRYRITTSGGPDFAYELCSRRAATDQPVELDLSSWKVAFNGAEPVQAATLERFANQFAACGFRRAAFLPCYGLAEATLFVTGELQANGPPTITADRGELALRSRFRSAAEGMELVSCGSPAPGVQLLLVDPDTSVPVNPGQQGEIWLAGDVVAQGYFVAGGDDQDTAAFGARTADGCGPYLRTGDLGIRHDGQLYVTGRNSDLIIVRGRNLFPQDIERTAQDTDTAVVVGGVAAFGEAHQGEAGIGIVIEVRQGAGQDWLACAGAIAQAVSTECGAAVWRVALVRQGLLPRTTSGKVRRSRAKELLDAGELPLLALRTRGDIPVVVAESPAAPAPSEPQVERVLQLIAAAAKIELHQVWPQHTLPGLGLDSLAIVQLQHQIQREGGVDLALDFMLEGCTVAELLGHATHGKPLQGNSPSRDPHAGAGSLSEYQKRFPVLNRLRTDAATFTVALRLDLQGPLDAALLQRSLGAAVRRHDALWLTLNSRGEPSPESAFPPRDVALEWLRQPELSACAANSVEDFFARPFDLNKGPLYRFGLVETGTDHHQLLVSFHHIVADGWSVRVICREVMALYDAALRFEAPQLAAPVPHQRFVDWQSQLDHREALIQLRAAFAGAPQELALGREPEEQQDKAAGAYKFCVPAALSQALKSRAAERGLSPATLWLAAFSLLLARLADQPDLVVGTPAVTREFPGAADAVGLLLNLVPVRIQVQPEASLGDHWLATARALAQARLYRNVPFERVLDVLRRDRTGQRSALFQVLFNYLPDAHFSGEIESLRYRAEPVLDVGAKFDLTLYVAEDAQQEAQRQTLHFAFDTSRFSERRIEVFAEQLQALVSRMCADADARAWDVPLRAGVPLLETVTANPWVGSIDEQVASWSKHPVLHSRLAMEWRGGSLSYRALDKAANAIAERLLALGVTRGTVVAILAERLPTLPVAILAVLRAGGVFCVVDAAYPAERVSNMLAQASPAAILVCADGDVQLARDIAVPLLRLAAVDLIADEADGAITFESPPKQPDVPACLTFTSGSGGTPRAVLGSHGGLAAFLPWQVQEFALSPNERVCLLSGLSHDPLQRDIFTAWWAGACLVVPPKDIRDSAVGLSQWVAEARISMANLTPSLARVLIAGHGERAPLDALRLVFLVGETVHSTDVQKLRELAPRVEVVGLYGATETQRALAHFRMPPELPLRPHATLGMSPPGMELLVLRPNGQRADVGEVAEICLRSPHLALGYLALGYVGRSESAASPFCFDEGAQRRYHSGDRGWYTARGEIRFAGRTDRQVNVFGYRVELAEVEQAAAALRGLLAVRAKWWEQSGQLVLYCVPDAAQATSVQDVVQGLVQRLPRHMVAHQVVLLDALPLTPNGKCDDGALPMPLRHESDQPPATTTECALAELWQALLDCPHVFREDSFIGLGGHSLKALSLQADIARRFDTHLPLVSILNSLSLSDMAAAIDAQSGHAHRRQPILQADPDAAHLPFPLNDIQRAYLVGRQVSMKEAVVGSQSYYEYESKELDLARLERAWNKVVALHGMLRAVVTDDWQQRVMPQVRPYQIVVHDWYALPEQECTDRLRLLRERMTGQWFDPTHWPMFQIEASRWVGGSLRLHFCFDFLVADAWSWNILLRDLNQAYFQPDAELQAPGLQFRDYVLAEVAWRGGEKFARALAFWRDRMRTLPPAPQLPMAMAPEHLAAPTFVRRSRQLCAADWESFKRLAAKAGATPASALLSVFGSVVACWSKSPRFTINLTLFDRRPWHEDVAKLVGDFTSVLLVPMDFSERRTAAQQALASQLALWECLDHRDVSGVHVMRELNVQASDGALRTMPIVFTSKLGLRQSAENTLPSWLGAEVYGVSQTPQVWLDSQVSEDEEGNLKLHWDAIDALFEPGVLEGMLDAFAQTLSSLAASEALWQTEAAAPLPASDIAMQRAANETAALVPKGLLHQPVLAQAQRTPDAAALIDAGQSSLSFAELHARAKHAAKQLVALDIRGEMVAIFMPKSVEQIVAVLACHLSGNTYVPIDASQGEARIAFMLASIGCRTAFVNEAHVHPVLVNAGVTAVVVDLREAAPVLPPGSSLSEHATLPADPAYVIFTSGSTGEPKGVVISHRGALNTCDDINQRFKVTSEDCVLAISALSFDLSVYDIFGVLGAGGRAVIPRAEHLKDPHHWLMLMDRQHVTIWNTVPALMQMLVQYCEDRALTLPASLRLVLLSGDWIPVNLPERIRKIARNPAIISLGGATEVSIWSVLHPVQHRSYEKSIPYGRPMTNQSIHVLDHQLRPRPCLVPGELYIGGVGLADGYWGDAPRTATAFVTNPHTGERLYRTGDLGRWQRDGEVEFLGREDFQVKIQGFRVELGEIEAALDGLAEIERSVVAVVGARGEAQRLVAYLVSAGGQKISNGQIRTSLGTLLPAYMIPAAFMQLDVLPLTENGKVDRKRLPPPETAAPTRAAPRGMLTPHQKDVCRIFAEVLCLPEVDPSAGFFDLGGTSLEVIKVQGGIRKAFMVEPSVADIFRYGTAISLGEHVAQLVAQQQASVVASAQPTGTHHRVDMRKRRGDAKRRALAGSQVGSQTGSQAEHDSNNLFEQEESQ